MARGVAEAEPLALALLEALALAEPEADDLAEPLALGEPLSIMASGVAVARGVDTAVARVVAAGVGVGVS